MTEPATLLEGILDELQKLRRLEEERQQLDSGTPLSRAAFCRVLGIDLRTTLEPLIEKKKLKTVPWTRGEVRIPVSELRRLQRDGIPQLSAPEKCQLPARSALRQDSGESFRSIPIE